MTLYDYLYIAGFFVNFLVIGVVFRRHTKNTSDYFRGGGAMTWWMCGASAFVQGFSAWTFVGLAGAIYSRGSMMAWIFITNAVGYLLCVLFTAARYRRLRVIVWVEALRQRYGRKTEQLFAYINIFIGLLYGGSGLYILSVFMSAVFGISVMYSIVLAGSVIIIMAVTGGSWATTASDFVQSLVIMAIIIVTAVLTLLSPDVGGISGFIAKVPDTHWTWGFDVSRGILILWLTTFCINNISIANSLHQSAARLIMVKDERSACKAICIPLVGSIIFPVITFIPPLAATFLFPNISEIYPQLNFPKEAAYAAVAIKVLPAGMLGLLACAMFAATSTTLDSALNRNAGVFVRNIYMQLIRPKCGEKEAILVARITTCVLGVISIGIGLKFAQFKDLPIFELMYLIGSLLGHPITVPMLLAIFVRKVPAWAAASTVLVGWTVGFLTMKVFPVKDWFLEMLPNSTAQDLSDASWLIPNFLVTVISVAWFFSTRLFYKEPVKNTERAKEISQFFENQKTPIDLNEEGITESDGEQSRIMAKLCMAYSSVLILGVFIPNPLSGRIVFLIVGGVIFLLGAGLRYAGRRADAKAGHL